MSTLELYLFGLVQHDRQSQQSRGKCCVATSAPFESSSGT